MPLRIAFITGAVAPYRVPLFSAIAQSPGCSLLVVSETAGEPRRRWQVDAGGQFDHVVLDSWTLDLNRAAADVMVHVPRHPLRELRRFEPDVVVAGGTGIWTSPANLAALGARGRRAGGGWGLVPYWGSWGAPEAREQRLAPARRLLRPLSRSFVRRGDAWIAYGSRARRELVSLGADPARVVVAPNAVPEISAGWQDAGDRPWRFLFAGQLVARKGVDVLLEAFEALPGDAELLIAGDGPFREEVQRAAARDRRIRYLGHLAPDDLARAYREAHALVLPARYEVWGLVVNEALAHGLPVVATDRVGAVDDLVSDGINGVVVESGSATALTAGMARLAAWTPEALDRSRAYSQEVLAGWTIDAAARGVVRAARLAADARTTISAT